MHMLKSALISKRGLAHQKSSGFSRGFTLVEVLVVVLVIAILVAISLVSFRVYQQSARDTKRQTDAVIFMSALEKYYDENGEYPTGCPASGCATSLGTFLSWNGGTNINEQTSLADLQDLLGPSVKDIGDPKSTSANPFSYRGATAPYTFTFPANEGYFYFGGITIVPPTVGVSAGATNIYPFAYKDNRRIRCNLHYTYNITQSSENTVYASMFGYYSEAEDKIIVITSRRGIQPQLQGSTGFYNTPDKCRVVRS